MKNNELWYENPADNWFQALPLGNGRIGAMVYGGIDSEIIHLSESTCFSGMTSNSNKKNALKYLASIRKALDNRDYKKATEISENIIGVKGNYGTNLPIGKLILNFGHKNNTSSYIRKLDLRKAINSTQYEYEDNVFSREMFISNKYQVIAIKLTSKNNLGLDFSAKLIEEDNEHKITQTNNSLVLTGNAYEKIHSDGKCGVQYVQQLFITTDTGNIKIENNIFYVQHANQATIYLSINTTFNNLDPSIPKEIETAYNKCSQEINNANKIGYEFIRKNHIKDYQNLYNRVDFKLQDDKTIDLPTDIRLRRIKDDFPDNGLSVLMFNYGRYLLISSSRENSPLPAHLQGVFNDNQVCRIGWTVDMHLDINTQMNYWAAHTTNLPECSKPLFDWLVNIIVKSGTRTAKETYGANGWVAHTVSNPWGFTAPGYDACWGFHPTAGAWIALHAFEHYEYTNDIEFLKNYAYPLIKESVKFFLDFLYIDKKTDYLVTGPSFSPENAFRTKGVKSFISVMPTCDIAILTSLFKAFIIMAEAINKDSDMVINAENSLKLFPPYQIGSRGQLQEWLEDYEEVLPNHRHTTHLLGVLFGEINPDDTPELVKAAEISIKNRMTPEDEWEDTGWARSMLMYYAARLRNKKMCSKHILDMQKYITEDNLFVVHPATAGAISNVYELDGNTGICASITEMLLQSYSDTIHLLPSIPYEWKNGSVKGLVARGGYTVDIYFENNTLSCAVIYGERNSKIKIRYNSTIISTKLGDNGKIKLNNNLIIL